MNELLRNSRFGRLVAVFLAIGTAAALWMAFDVVQLEKKRRNQDVSAEKLRSTLRIGCELQTIVNRFKVQRSRYPTFNELHSMIRELYWGNLEFISERQAAKLVTNQLTGDGGWIYDDTAGRISLNWTNGVWFGTLNCVVYPTNFVLFPSPTVRFDSSGVDCNLALLRPTTNDLISSSATIQAAEDLFSSIKP